MITGDIRHIVELWKRVLIKVYHAWYWWAMLRHRRCEILTRKSREKDAGEFSAGISYVPDLYGWCTTTKLWCVQQSHNYFRNLKKPSGLESALSVSYYVRSDRSRDRSVRFLLYMPQAKRCRDECTRPYSILAFLLIVADAK